MATEVGSAYVSIIPSMQGFGAKLSAEASGAATQAGSSSGGKFASTFKSFMTPLGLGLSALGAVKVFGGFIADARESARVGAITASVIKSTGGAANLTAQQVGDLASAISRKTGIDDEQIQSNANVLLSFTNVRNELGKGNDIFSQSVGLAQDMATVMGTDAKGASLQLGKALNDPIKGISALSRAGVSFTAEQKEQIKTLVSQNDILGAQKIILREVGTEFGGAAEAAATPMAKLKVQVGNVGEAIGALLIPAIDKGAIALSGVIGAVGGFTNFLSSNKTTIGIVAGVITAVFIPALIAMGVQSTVTAAKAVASWVTQQAAAIAGAAAHSLAVVKVVAGWVLMGVQSLLAAAKMAAAWIIALGPIALAIAAVVGITVLVVKNWDTIKDATGKAWTWVVDKVKAIAGAILNFFQTWTIVGQVVKHWDDIRAGTQRVWGAIKDWLSAVPGAIVAFFTKWTLVGVVVSHFGEIKAGVVDKVGALLDYVGGIPGRVTGALGNLGGLLYGAGKAIIQGLIDGIQAMLGSLHSALSKVTGLIPDWKGPMSVDRELLRPTGQAIMGGLQTGMTDELPNLRNKLGDVTASISAGVPVSAPGTAPAPQVRVFIGDRELTDMIRVEVDGGMRAVSSAIQQGRRA